MTTSVGVHEAKTHLSGLLEQVAAGEEIVITSRGRPVAKLTAVSSGRRTFGIDVGVFTVPEDFDAPLGEDELDAFETVRLLLDTHVLLWLQTDPDRLGMAAETLALEEHELLLSAASSWEIAITSALGRLSLPEDAATYVPDRARRSDVLLLPIDHADALATASLPPHHRDPFDRLLVAQAQRRDLTLVTADRQLEAYAVQALLIEA